MMTISSTVREWADSVAYDPTKTETETAETAEKLAVAYVAYVDRWTELVNANHGTHIHYDHVKGFFYSDGHEAGLSESDLDYVSQVYSHYTGLDGLKAVTEGTCFIVEDLTSEELEAVSDYKLLPGTQTEKEREEVEEKMEKNIEKVIDTI